MVGSVPTDHQAVLQVMCAGDERDHREAVRLEEVDGIGRHDHHAVDVYTYRDVPE